MAKLLAFFTNKFFKVLFILYVTLFSTIWLVSAPIIKHFATPLIVEQNLHLDDDASIRFNPFLMRLTLNDIKLSRADDPAKDIVLSLEELHVQVAVWQLLIDRITISQVLVENGILKVTQHDGHTVVAGIDLPTASEEKTTEQEAIDESEIATEQTAEFPYTLILGDFLISQFAIEIERDTQQQKNKTHHIDIEEFALNQVKATKESQEGNLSIKALIDQTALEVSANAQLTAGQGDIRSFVSLTNYPMGKLTRYVDALKELKGTLSFKSNQTVTLGQNKTNIKVQRGGLDLQNLYVGLEEQHITLSKLNHIFKDIDISIQDGEIVDLAGQSSFNLSNILVLDNENKATIAGLKQLDIDDINFVLDDEPSIDIADITLSEFVFSKKAKLTDEMAQKAMESINELSAKHGVEVDAESLVKLPPVMELKQLTLNKLHIHEKSIAINSIIFDSLTGDIIVKENKELANLVALSNKPAATETVADEPSEQTAPTDVKQVNENTAVNNEVASVETKALPVQAEVTTQSTTAEEMSEPAATDAEATNQDVAITATEPKIEKEQAQAENEVGVMASEENTFTFSLNEIRFINNNSFHLTDFSVEPIYNRTLFIDTFEVGALSNAKGKQDEQTPFALAGRSNKYANFDLAGTLQPFSAVPSYHLTGDLKEFSLPAISSYLKGSTGLEVKTGQLNTEIDVTLTGDELDGNVIVLVQALETALVDSDEAGALINQGALPLNMAMGMLKDSDGNVELDVPISGSTSDPSFGLSSIVTLITKKAIYSATQDYLMTTFVPYANIVSIAVTAGEFALKLRFDDLIYQEKQVAPDQQQDTYINDFITLMKEKEDTRVTICAISTPGDLGLKAGAPITDKANTKKLIELGEQREHAFKDHLIEQGEIKSARILFCKPQIDTDVGAKPRIEISV